MATSPQALILAAFLDRLAALTLSPPLLTALPGIPFPPGDTKPENYLIAEMIFNATRQITLGPDAQQKRGIFQVTVVWQANVGLVKPLDVAGAIIAHFNNQTLFASGVRITISSEPWAASPIQDADRISIPVSIPWHAFEPES